MLLYVCAVKQLIMGIKDGASFNRVKMSHGHFSGNRLKGHHKDVLINYFMGKIAMSYRIPHEKLSISLAAHGYDLHYKINREHRHCDMPLSFVPSLAPQTRSHALLALGAFGLTSIFFERMEQRLANKLETCQE